MVDEKTRHFGRQILWLVPAWIWLSLAVIAVIDGLWLSLSVIDLSPASFTAAVQIACLAAGSLYIAMRLPAWPRMQTMAFGGAFLLIAWPVLRIFNHLLMSAGMPLADQQLAAIDAGLGFDWIAYVKWVDRAPVLSVLMEACYGSLTSYVSLLFGILLVSRDGLKYCRELIALFMITAVACSTIGMFFPAVAAAQFYQPAQSLFTHINPHAGSYHLDHLAALRSGLPMRLDLDNLPGLVTFPSFHTAMGIIAIYCARGSRLLLPASIIVNGIMIASTPVFGAHYLVDVVGGGLVSLVAIAIYRTVSARRRTTETAVALPAAVIRVSV